MSAVEPTRSAEIARAVEWTAAGQVITYKSERDNRWCREGWAISNEHGAFLDTYWMSMGDAHHLTSDELATARHEFWLDDYTEMDRYRRATADEWATYAPDDRRRVPSQHGLQTRYFIRTGAQPDLPTRVQNASDALEQADNDMRRAQQRRASAESRLRALQTDLDERANPPAPTDAGGRDE